ncbi:hypothetical protein HZA57_03915 [Candidatus Poribacteria bacterium]|nr:hypothetical protein [Candidatus Poribacteria bacterium]
MPAFFVDSGWAALEYEPTEQALARLVSDLMAGVRGIDDPRVADVRETWSAIQGADAPEREFCVMAGRLGLDPYDAEELPDSVAAVLERLSEANDPLVEDVTTVASPNSLGEQWNWIDHMRNSHELVASPAIGGLPRAHANGRADTYGYEVAREFRERASLPPDRPLDSVEVLGTQVLGFRLESIHENHLPGRGIRLIAGKGGTGTAQVIGPAATRPEAERFRVARGLFLVAVASARGPRLVTDAFTWEQKASRAFAAELIAPREALRVRVERFADRDTIRDLASEFRASTVLIEKQLQNAQIFIEED